MALGCIFRQELRCTFRREPSCSGPQEPGGRRIIKIRSKSLRDQTYVGANLLGIGATTLLGHLLATLVRHLMAHRVSHLQENAHEYNAFQLKLEQYKIFRSTITVVQTLWEPSLHLELGSCLQGSQCRRRYLLFTVRLKSFQYI